MVKLFGHETTTMSDKLTKIGNALFNKKGAEKRYLGTYPQDKLPDEIFRDDHNRSRLGSKFAIVNTHSAGGKGEHWMAIAKIANSDSIMVFDSFGRATKKILPIIAGQSKKANFTIKDTEYDKEQLDWQNSCGQFSMAWLKFFELYGPKNAKLI